MDAYHIFEEVGRGKYSVVYKGREKKTVKYVAIKSVDKGAKLDKVQHEVQLLYRLNHPNVLRFFRWYETRHHIWLILEYCTGGSLKELLAHDKRLPESALRVFGTDLVHALHYLHSNGVLFCDLKPSNVLLNEYGVLKLCDFALSATLDSSGGDGKGKDRVSRLRGTPCYMAPELFGEEGVHSFASDLWSLGCVLYEMAMGHLPFFSSTFSELVEIVQTRPLELPVGSAGHPAAAPAAPTPSSAGATTTAGGSSTGSSSSSSSLGEDNLPLPELRFSVQFKNLLRSLLRKDPAKRISWPALLTHEFWGNMPMPKLVPMPPIPAYQEYLRTRKYVPGCPAEDSDDDDEFGEDDTDDHSSVAAAARTMLSRASSSSSSISSSSRSKGGGGLTGSMRLSLVAKRNLLRESVESGSRDSYRNEEEEEQEHKDSYNKPLQPEDLVLEDADTVLDFGDHPDTPVSDNGGTPGGDEFGVVDLARFPSATMRSIGSSRRDADEMSTSTADDVSRPRTAPFAAASPAPDEATGFCYDDDHSSKSSGLNKNTGHNNDGGGVAQQQWPSSNAGMLSPAPRQADRRPVTAGGRVSPRPPDRHPSVQEAAAAILRLDYEGDDLQLQHDEQDLRRKPAFINHDEVPLPTHAARDPANQQQLASGAHSDDEQDPNVFGSSNSSSSSSSHAFGGGPTGDDAGALDLLGPSMLKVVSGLQASFQERIFRRQVEMLVLEDVGKVSLFHQPTLQLGSLMYGPTDHLVRPIVGNPVNGSLPSLRFSQRALGFPCLPAEQVSALSGDDLGQFFSLVFRSLSNSTVITGLASGGGGQAVAPSPRSSGMGAVGAGPGGGLGPGQGGAGPSGASAVVSHLTHVLGYLYTLCRSPRLANVIVSSSLLSLLLRLGSKTELFVHHLTPNETSEAGSTDALSTPPSTPTRGGGGVGGGVGGGGGEKRSSTFQSQMRKLRVRVAIVIAVLVRHATFIAPRIGEEGLVDLFVSLAQEADLPLRRYGAAGLGELLFYITTNSNIAPASEAWKIPASALKQLHSCLQSEDEAVRHYAAKTYENVLSTTMIPDTSAVGSASASLSGSSAGASVPGTPTASSASMMSPGTPGGGGGGSSVSGGGSSSGLRFATHGIVTDLLDMAFREKSESLRSTSAMALSHLVRLNPRLLPKLGERGGWEFLVHGLQALHGFARVQQAYLNILNMVLSSSGGAGSGSSSGGSSGGGGGSSGQGGQSVQATGTGEPHGHGIHGMSHLSSHMFHHNHHHYSSVMANSGISTNASTATTSNKPLTPSKSGGGLFNKPVTNRVTREALFGTRSQVKECILKALIQLLAHAQPLLCGKAVLALALFLRAYPQDFSLLVELRFVPAVDRLYGHLVSVNNSGGHNTDTLQLRRCLLSLLGSVRGVVEEAIAQLGRARRKLGAALASGRTIGDASPEASLLQRLARDVLPPLVHVSSSRALRALTWSPALVASLARLVQVAAHCKPGSAPEFHRLVFVPVEALVSQADALLRPEMGAQVVGALLPALWRHQLKGDRDVRVLCLRLCADVVATYLHHASFSQDGQDEDGGQQPTSAWTFAARGLNDPGDPGDFAERLAHAVHRFFLKKMLPRARTLLAAGEAQSRVTAKITFSLLASAVTAETRPHDALECWRKAAANGLLDAVAAFFPRPGHASEAYDDAELHPAALLPLLASIMRVCAAPGGDDIHLDVAMSRSAARRVLGCAPHLFAALQEQDQEDQLYLLSSTVTAWQAVLPCLQSRGNVDAGDEGDSSSNDEGDSDLEGVAGPDGSGGSGSSVSPMCLVVIAIALEASVLQQGKRKDAELYRELVLGEEASAGQLEQLLLGDVDVDDVVVDRRLLASTAACLAVLNDLFPRRWARLAAAILPLLRLVLELELDGEDEQTLAARLDIERASALLGLN